MTTAARQVAYILFDKLGMGAPWAHLLMQEVGWSIKEEVGKSYERLGRGTNQFCSTTS